MSITVRVVRTAIFERNTLFGSLYLVRRNAPLRLSDVTLPFTSTFVTES